MVPIHPSASAIIDVESYEYIAWNKKLEWEQENEYASVALGKCVTYIMIKFANGFDSKRTSIYFATQVLTYTFL